jgi:hypothetical protein
VQELGYPGDSGRAYQIGKTIATEKFSNTADSFWISINPDTVINPFDFVTVRHIYDTKTIGLVKELQAIDSVGIVARIVVMANTGMEKSSGKLFPVGMPVGGGRPARFSSEKEVMFALGIPEMENPIPSGVVEMTNGLQVPISLDTSYLLGPDTAHVNAAGISGNQKTSYLLFLLQSTYQRLTKEQQEGVAIVIFNTKEQDLLHLGEKKRNVKGKNKRLYDLLDLELEPFSDVTYFLPRGSDGRPNSAYLPKKYKTYSFGLEDVYDRLDLLFDLQDRRQTISSILNYIYEEWPIRAGGDKITTWKELLTFKDYPQEVIPHKSTVFGFLGGMQRILRSPIFTDKKVRSKYLGKEIGKLESGDVFVIDIAMLPTVEEQGFVVGDVMKSIDQLYSARHRGTKSRPRFILIFVDEINRFAPHEDAGNPTSPVTDQIMRTLVAGRSRGTILFSAQQFKSAVNPAIHENIGMHIIAKLGSSELSSEPYKMLDESTKSSIVRLNKGELVMVHPAFRHPIKVIFPKAPFRSG